MSGTLFWTDQTIASSSVVELVFDTTKLRGTNETWRINNTAVTSTSQTATACKIFRGLSNVGNFIDGTGSGNGDSSNTVYTLNPGEFITLRWENVTVGATCGFTVMGTREFVGIPLGPR